MKTFTALILALTLSACSTVAGVGKDIQSTAEWTKKRWVENNEKGFYSIANYCGIDSLWY